MVDAIPAAGTIVWRRNESGEVEVAIIHRPKYDDWSFPKGKCEAGENSIACAYRETVEETGFEIRFKEFLGEISYSAEGTAKLVKYWSAKFLRQVGTPLHGEVDQVLWKSPNETEELLSRESDREILKRFLGTELDTQVLILLRHAKAIAREDWQNEDLDRPLSTIGEHS